MSGPQRMPRCTSGACEDGDEVVVRAADEAQLVGQALDDAGARDDEGEAGDGRTAATRSTAAAARAGRQRREAEQAVAGEQAQRRWPGR